MKNKLKAFSLVELLITLVILSIVMLICTQTLNTLLRVSTLTKYKNMARNEIEFSVELTDRLLSNSYVPDVQMFNSSLYRTFDEENNVIITSDSESDPYLNSYIMGTPVNEVHVRPYGHKVWVCIGFFKSNDLEDPDHSGYFLKRTVSDLNNGH